MFCKLPANKNRLQINDLQTAWSSSANKNRLLSQASGILFSTEN